MTHAIGQIAAAPIATPAPAVAATPAAAPAPVHTVSGGGGSGTPWYNQSFSPFIGSPMGFYQSMVEEGLDHLYSVTLGPILRQHTNSLVHEPYTPAYKPPNTPGMVAREEVTNWVGNIWFGLLLKWMRDKSPLHSRIATGGSVNLAASALGAQGVNAMMAESATTEAAKAVEYRLLVGRSAVYYIALTAFNAFIAAKAGPFIEDHVNKLFGVKVDATTTKNIRGGVPAATVKQSFEQAARQFGRTFSQGIEGTVAMGVFGVPLYNALRSKIAAKIAVGGMERVAAVGAAAALEGANPLLRLLPVALSAMISVGSVSAVSGVLNWAFGNSIANITQRAARMGEALLHRPLDNDTPPDIVPTPGDRVAQTIEYALLIPGMVSGVSGASEFNSYVG